MISHIGKVSLECFKTVKGLQKEEIDGKIQDKEVEVTLRFDFGIPMGSPYELVHEVLAELKEEVNKMQEMSKKQAEEREKQDKLQEDEIEGEIKKSKKGHKNTEEN